MFYNSTHIVLISWPLPCLLAVIMNVLQQLVTLDSRGNFFQKAVISSLFLLRLFSTLFNQAPQEWWPLLPKHSRAWKCQNDQNSSMNFIIAFHTIYNHAVAPWQSHFIEHGEPQGYQLYWIPSWWSYSSIYSFMWFPQESNGIYQQREIATQNNPWVLA